MAKWGIGTFASGLVLLWLATHAMTAQGQQQTAPYGASGHWEAPLISDLCADTQRCAEWHDDTDGEAGPRTLCCVEESNLPRNSFRDCVIAFRMEPRDG